VAWAHFGERLIVPGASSPCAYESTGRTAGDVHLSCLASPCGSCSPALRAPAPEPALCGGTPVLPLPSAWSQPGCCTERDFSAVAGLQQQGAFGGRAAGEGSPCVGSVSLPCFVNGLNAWFKRKKKNHLLKAAWIRSLIKHSAEKP